ncbi:MAG TPA: hypothetical protein DEH78_20575 [Solibacterales bacterium]|nr:hypothetical protein [Bryobacterales bacterium]
MFVFPLSIAPKEHWRRSGLRFGDPRTSKDPKTGETTKRRHAGCDLMTSAGAEVRAVTSGKVTELIRDFRNGTSAVVIRHDVPPLACDILYGEIVPLIKPGDTVFAGEVIGRVQRHPSGGAMLHLELYRKGPGVKASVLTANKAGFKRRSDLQDPADLLDLLFLMARPKQAPESMKVHEVSF